MGCPFFNPRVTVNKYYIRMTNAFPDGSCFSICSGLPLLRNDGAG